MNTVPMTSPSGHGHWSELVVGPRVWSLARAVVFDHHGAMGHDAVGTLLATAERTSLEANDPVALRKRLFNVLVEALENVHRHTPKDLEESVFALLVRRDGGYGLSVGNALPSASAAVLADRVATLNHMDEADLREHYLKLLANEGRTERGGAGLGLLTMVRKSGGNVKVYTLPRDERSSFLALELFIG